VLGLGSALVVSSAGASGPAGPTTRTGQPAQLVVKNVFTPTSFAFGDGVVFWSDGTPPTAAPVGGVYALINGTATKLAGSPAFSFGVTWHDGALYVSAVNSIEAWSGWNGTGFAKQKTIYTGPKGFSGFNGLGFGADGRLYANVGLSETNDHGPATAPYEYDILSMTATGKQVKIVARGIRQPWQMAFPAKSSSPYVSDLGQDSGATNPPDFILRVKNGQNYGFPKCNQTVPNACMGYAKPFQSFPSHNDPMGVGILGQRLYISEFGAATPDRVVSIPLSGGHPRVELSGFPAKSNIVGLGVHNGWVYVAQVASGATALGNIYRFKP
jgi:glucose/arabinose dehydrogenase